jgi:hypothetical protein
MLFKVFQGIQILLLFESILNPLELLSFIPFLNFIQCINNNKLKIQDISEPNRFKIILFFILI